MQVNSGEFDPQRVYVVDSWHTPRGSHRADEVKCLGVIFGACSSLEKARRLIPRGFKRAKARFPQIEVYQKDKSYFAISALKLDTPE